MIQKPGKTFWLISKKKNKICKSELNSVVGACLRCRFGRQVSPTIFLTVAGETPTTVGRLITYR